MTAVLKLFWDMCLLRGGPESVPTHTWFLCALLAAQLTLAVLMLGMVSPALPTALAFNVALINLAVTASVVWFVLYVRRLDARFPATLGAVLGTGLVIDAAFTMVHGVTSGVVQQGAFYVCSLWGVVVVGFILHRALSCKLWAGVLLSFGVALISIVIGQAALGPALMAALGASPS